MIPPRSVFHKYVMEHYVFVGQGYESQHDKYRAYIRRLNKYTLILHTMSRASPDLRWRMGCVWEPIGMNGEQRFLDVGFYRQGKIRAIGRFMRAEQSLVLYLENNFVPRMSARLEAGTVKIPDWREQIKILNVALNETPKDDLLARMA